MILPRKHISPEHALFSIGGEILEALDEPSTVSALWDRISRKREGRTAEYRLSFDWFVLALSFLYAVLAIDLNGVLIRKRDARLDRK